MMGHPTEPPLHTAPACSPHASFSSPSRQRVILSFDTQKVRRVDFGCDLKRIRPLQGAKNGFYT